MKPLLLLFLIFLSCSYYSQVSALIEVVPQCGYYCDGLVYVDFEDQNDNSPYTISLYSINSNPPNYFEDSIVVNTNDTLLSFNALCNSGNREIIISDVNGDTTVFIAYAPYLSLQGLLYNCCSYGVATSEAFGGVSPYTFTLQTSMGDITQVSNHVTIFDSLACSDGIQNIIITDSIGCSVYYTPLVDALCSGAQDPNCLKEIYLNGQNTSDTSICDGSIIWEIEGVDTTTSHQLIITGFNGYNDTIFLAPGILSDTLDSLCSGTYYFKLDMDSSCFDVTTITLSDPSPIVYTSFLNSDSITGCTSCQNMIQWDFVDYFANGPYQFYLSDDQGIIVDSSSFNWNNNSGTISFICEGTYDLLIVDVNGDSLSSSIEVIDDTNALILDTLNILLPYTNQSNGQIQLASSGGTSPYQYSIDNGITWQSNDIFSGLPSGAYTVIVKDDNGCESSITLSLFNGDVGIEQHEFDFVLYPNPSNGQFIVKVANEHKFRIVDLQGRIILEGYLEKECIIDLSRDSKGIYLFILESNQKCSVTRLIMN